MEADATQEQIDAAISAEYATVSSAWNDALRKATAGSGTAEKTDVVYGSCGWSSITLTDLDTGSYQARVTAKIQLNRRGWAYRTNGHVWYPRWTDFSDIA